MIDYSPPDDEPTFEQAISVPLGPPKHDADGSITGCAVCGKQFARFMTRIAYVRVGELLFRHPACAQTREDRL